MKDDDLDNLEQQVEREMQLLRHLPPAEPDAACVARVQAAVERETIGVRRKRRNLTVLRSALGLAAALALAVLLTNRSLPTAAPDGGSPEATIAEWAAAWDESSTRVGELLADGLVSGSPAGTSTEQMLDDVLESLDRSLSQLEAL